MSPRLLALCLLVGVAGCEAASVSHALAMKTIGASGGQVALADGTSVTIPAGALAADETITISTATTTTADAVGPAYTFGPEGLMFARAATVTLPYTPSGHATVIVTAPANGTSFTALTTSHVDATHESAPTMHFSTFVIASGAFDAGGELAESDLALHDAGLTDASGHDAAMHDASVLGDASTHSDASVDGSMHADASTHGDASTLDALMHSDAAMPSDAAFFVDASMSGDASVPGDLAVGCVPNPTAAPALPAGQNITFTITSATTGASTVQQLPDTSQQTQWDDRGSSATYDASGFVDPALCSSSGLVFHWSITSNGEPIDDVTITGTETSKLTFAPNSVPAVALSISLLVTSLVSGLTSSYILPARVTASGMSLTTYNACQGQTMACATCQCTDPNALKSP